MSRRLSRKSVESICASAGSDMPSVTRPLTAPIYQNSVFEIDSLEQVDDIYEGRQDGFIYSRDANPNVAILEQVVAELENADDSVAFASGLGAIAVTLLSLVESGDTIVAGQRAVRRHQRNACASTCPGLASRLASSTWQTWTRSKARYETAQRSYSSSR